jgi:hypothetical protein
MAAKNPITVRRSKFALNKGADLPLSGAMAFEIPIQPFANKPGRFATAAWKILPRQIPAPRGAKSPRRSGGTRNNGRSKWPTRSIRSAT